MKKRNRVFFVAVCLVSLLPLAAVVYAADEEGSNLTPPQPRPLGDEMHPVSERFNVEGYGEHLFARDRGAVGTFEEQHGILLDLGYQLSERLSIGTRLEAAFASVESEGIAAVDELWLEVAMVDELNLRVGRAPVPVSWHNLDFQPLGYVGVSQPYVETYIVPNNWTVDGAGVFGNLGAGLSYQAIVGKGLQSECFCPSNGFGGDDLEQNADFTNPAVMGRLDLEFDVLPDAIGNSGVGVFGYMGETQTPTEVEGVETNTVISMVSMEARTGYRSFKLHGFYAMGSIEDAFMFDGVAKQFVGYSLQGSVNVYPDRWRKGWFEDADLNLFMRYEVYDTQHEMPEGVEPDTRYDRDAWSTGFSFLPIRHLAFKAEYQLIQNQSFVSTADQVVVGIGWGF
ncbi:hypothetical protein KQI52_04830 [bacterium]|nr:hypothetical protein [bacterium]